MIRSLLFFLLFIPVSVLYAQTGNISGLLVSGDERLGSASVKNISSYAQAYSNDKGEFKIQAKKGDTLITSKTNYVTDTSVVNADPPIIIQLKKPPTMLKEVTVNGTVITPESVYAANKKDYKDIYRKGDKSHMFFVSQDLNVGVGAGVNIDKVYSALSKEGKDARRLQRTFTRDYKNSVVDQRFNSLAARITGYKGKKLDDFIQDNRPTYDIIAKSSDYDLIQYIKRRLPRVKRKSA